MNNTLPLLIALLLAPTLPARAAEEVTRTASMGCDPVEATAALQAALNSGARKVVVENMGAPWIMDNIQLASDHEIVFEKGVVVQARRGAFQGKGDTLFSASLKTNITLEAVKMGQEP